MHFLIDEQLPPGLAEKLRTAGYAADHVREIGLGGAADRDVQAAAERMGAVLVTKDEDFVVAGRSGRVAVVWVRLGNVTNRVLWRAMEPALAEIIAAIEAGETLVEFS